VLRSTVQPGTLREVVKPALEQASGKVADRDFGLAFQPEFLREGTSIKDYDNPPITIIGTESSRTGDILKALFGHLPCEFVVTSIGVAEVMKYAANAFHAVKITFANEIGRLSQSVGVDGRDVMDLICRDKQLNISRAYMRPGFAFGGSCLPKDLRALTYVGKQRDVNTPMLSAVMGSNRAHIDHAIERIMGAGIRRVGMIGLSFKKGTDDLRESPLVAVAERLIGKGYDLRIYDPEVNLSRLIGANKRFIEQSIPHIGSLMVEKCEDVVRHGDVVLVGHGGAEVEDVLRRCLQPAQEVVDVSGIDRETVAGTRYSGICW
jgi:GDP-mannose 6-dehydrogenase